MAPSADRCRRALVFVAGMVAAIVLLTPGPAASADGADPSVQAAIERGRKALLPKLAALTANPPGDYPMGRIAIVLAACLKAGTPTADETVRLAMSRLEGLPIQQTYSVACYLFALDAYWQARYRESLRKPDPKGTTAVGEAVPQIPPAGPIRKRMEELIAWLVRGSGGTWHYTGRGPGDLSNTQFAILGLDVGLQNEIPIDPEVFRAILEHFVKAHSATQASQQFTITFRSPAWEGITTGVTRRIAYVAYLGGWNYTSQASAAPSGNMTAAGVSSLLVARRALERRGQYAGDLAWQADRRIEAGLGWIGQNWGSYKGGAGQLYYGLYSVEKVGDIGGIFLFGSLDWYVDGSRFIVARQSPAGTWGGELGGGNGVEVDTALALLFLTRATRSHLQTMGPPVLFTRVKGDAADDADGSDVVYVAKLEGFVSASAIFDFLAETRDPKLIPIAEEAIRAFPPHRVDELLGRVVSLWKDERDAVSRFAAQMAAELAGVTSKERSDYELLIKGFRSVREMERSRAADVAQLETLLTQSRSPLLKRRALDLVDALGVVDAFGSVIERLLDADADVRRRAREVLVLWTGRRDEPALPEEKAARETYVAGWREWWKTQGESFRFSRRAAILIERLATEPDAKAADAVLQALVAMGRPAVPAILEALDREPCSLRAVLALESILGRSEGLRAADWRKVAGN